MNTSRKRRIVVLVGLGILGLALPPAAQGGFVATDLGPNNSFSPSFGYNLTGPQSSNLGVGWAVEFIVGGTKPVTFSSAELALSYQSGINTLNVVLMSDNGGTPGTALDSMSVTNIPVGPSLVTATSTTNPLLMPGTAYWLTASAPGNSAFVWMANSQGAENDLDFDYNIGFGFSPWIAFSGNPDVAYAINGASGLTGAASVSEPCSVLLLGFSAMGLIGLRMTRMRRAMSMTPRNPEGDSCPSTPGV